MKFLLLSSIVILNCIAFTFGQKNATTCHTTSWWVLLPMKKVYLDNYLKATNIPLTYNTSQLPFSSELKSDEHVVYLEFNKQNDCKQISLSFLSGIISLTFVEFKVQIPYLVRNDKNVMFKPLIYESKFIDTSATKLAYGLPAYTVSDKSFIPSASFSLFNYRQIWYMMKVVEATIFLSQVVHYRQHSSH
jgi:hypothetical protein